MVLDFNTGPQCTAGTRGDNNINNRIYIAHTVLTSELLAAGRISAHGKAQLPRPLLVGDCSIQTLHFSSALLIMCMHAEWPVQTKVTVGSNTLYHK